MFHHKSILFFFTIVLMYNSVDAMKRKRSSNDIQLDVKKNRIEASAIILSQPVPIMAIVDLSKKDLRRLSQLEQKVAIDCNKTKKSLAVTENNEKDLIFLPCSKSGCRYKAKTDLQLKSHFRFHRVQSKKKKVALLKCDDCDYLCDRESVFARHQKSHNSTKAYVCDICDKRLKYRDSLKRHMETIH